MLSFVGTYQDIRVGPAPRPRQSAKVGGSSTVSNRQPLCCMQAAGGLSACAGGIWAPVHSTELLYYRTAVAVAVVARDASMISQYLHDRTARHTVVGKPGGWDPQHPLPWQATTVHS